MSSPAHVWQNGHGPAPHPAQARGNTMSSARSSAFGRIWGTLRGAGDTVQGNATSTSSSAPLIAIVRAWWILSSG